MGGSRGARVFPKSRGGPRCATFAGAKAFFIQRGSTMTAAASPRVLPCGDTALAVEFGQAIDLAVNARVLALDARVVQGVPGVVETVPTYRSLLVHYDPAVTDFDTL